MSNILNIDEQVNRVIDEINRTYSKGIEFILNDLSSVRAVKDTSNFNVFISRCRSKIGLNIAIYLNGSGINQKFRKK